MKSTTLPIKGMHCHACELLLEDEISEVPGVKKVNVSQRNGCAEIQYKGKLDLNLIEEKIVNAGYEMKKDGPLPFISGDLKVYNQLAKAATALLILYGLGRWTGIFDIGNTISSDYNSLPIVFLVGLTAGISTCMALVGGLVLGVASRFSKKHPSATAQEKFTPHLYFQLGRIVSFVILGAAIGWLGSMLQLSLSLIGLLTIFVGLSMLILGTQLIEVFPRLSGWQLTLPKSLSKFIGMDERKQAEYSHKNSVMMGALTFFLPCGFTQSMQLYAMSTGSPIAGALTMGIFALGTAPGLLGIGGLTAAVKGAFAQHFFKFSGILVIFLALFNISNGLNLTGFEIATPSVFAQKEKQPALGNSGEVQLIKATYSADESIQPQNLTVKAGQPVKLEIFAEDNGVGCKTGVAIPALTKQTVPIKKGQSMSFEFTPQKKGTYPIVCSSMGMPYGSTITVL